MLEGGFSARLPTKSEIQDAIGDGLFAGQKLPKGFDETEGIGSNLMSEQVGLSLRKAAMQED